MYADAEENSTSAAIILSNEPRMAGGQAGGAQQKRRFHRRGRRLLNSAFTRSPCAALIVPQWRGVKRSGVLVARPNAALLD